MKKFDLNIETVLEDWGVHHALREIIANALDEQALTATNNIDIFKDGGGNWHIRDYGRGLRHQHLTQNEDKEKHGHSDRVIGKFGVGLKDALATFDRNGIHVRIKSKYGDIALGKEPKHGFASITTLHALIAEPSDPAFVGTDFTFVGVNDEDILRAKDFFLRFSREKLLEDTEYGQVLATAHSAHIYISGLRVADEKNFLFSYNITATNKAIRKALNRERTNVGRTAYADRVKAILLACASAQVARLLVEDLKRFEQGTLHDELTWLDVQIHACKLLNAAEKVIFLTPVQLRETKDMVDHARNDGYDIITVPDTVRAKLRGLRDLHGNPIRDLDRYIQEWNASFVYAWVSPKDLTADERAIWEKTSAILRLIGGKPKPVKEIRISTTMRMESRGCREAVGLWEAPTRRIIIKRSQLKSLSLYAGTLLHEAAHARSGALDVSLEFEEELTKLLGTIAHRSL